MQDYLSNPKNCLGRGDDFKLAQGVGRLPTGEGYLGIKGQMGQTFDP